ncbi:MAG TPA: UpxY family transcription antiterminator [Bacteroidales bacterium]|nr:UpxY family transcription antiterminator [Bacteroidales bacterium]
MEIIRTYSKDKDLGNPGKSARWYAIYTKPHHEKDVFKKLNELGIKGYLPLITTIRQWSDRKKKIKLPLFNCYVFVYITYDDYFRVLNIPGVVRFITFEGKAVAIPEKQIQVVMNLLQHEIEAQEIQYDFYKGATVEIVSGPLSGIFGELVNLDKKRVIIRISAIHKSMVIHVPMNLLRLVS